MCERYISQLPLTRPQTGDLAHNPGTCPDRESNWQPFSSQAGAQSTEPHQPGLYLFYVMYITLFGGMVSCSYLVSRGFKNLLNDISN